MKTLFILRHAKSSWDDHDRTDFERPLNERGLATATFIGELMAARDLSPQLIVSSPARRARQTAELVAKAAGFSAPLVFDERIYEASPLTLFNLIRELDDRQKTVMLVGHNPGFESIVRLLTRADCTMPTAALAKINLNIENWSEIEVDVHELEFLIRPKEEMKKNAPE